VSESQIMAVTGASGFVGRALVSRLVQSGHRVIALSRDHRGVSPMVEPASVLRVTTDYGDATALADTLRGVDVVFHLAARAHQVDEPQQPGVDALYLQANAEMTRRVATASRRAHVRRLVFVSSIGVNGEHTRGTPPFGASDAPQPASPYARSKLEAEQLLQSELASGPTDFVIVRPPLVYGPGCPGNFERLIRLVHRLPLVPLGGITAPRSFIHVANLADALTHLAGHPLASRQIFLASDGRDTSVAEVVRMLADALGLPPRRVRAVPSRLLEWAARLAGRQATYQKLADPLQVDSRPLRETLNWHPPTELGEGLRQTATAWRDALKPGV
jgi:nucleoside-diphosphate-sugar epimerase